MSFLPAVGYVAGIFVVGFVWGVMDLLVRNLRFVSETGDVYTYLNYLWLGVLIIYLIGGGYWVVRKYSEYPTYQGGY